MAKFRNRQPRKPAPTQPTDAKSGAPRVRKLMLTLFDREDGQAADWPLIAETLFLEVFHAVDQAPHSERTALILRSVHDAAYTRMAEPAAPQTDQARAPSARAAFEGPQRDFSDAPKV